MFNYYQSWSPGILQNMLVRSTCVSSSPHFTGWLASCCCCCCWWLDCASGGIKTRAMKWEDEAAKVFESGNGFLIGWGVIIIFATAEIELQFDGGRDSHQTHYFIQGEMWVDSGSMYVVSYTYHRNWGPTELLMMFGRWWDGTDLNGDFWKLLNIDQTLWGGRHHEYIKTHGPILPLRLFSWALNLDTVWWHGRERKKM